MKELLAKLLASPAVRKAGLVLVGAVGAVVAQHFGLDLSVLLGG
jgi:hypothetical protein